MRRTCTEPIPTMKSMPEKVLAYLTGQGAAARQTVNVAAMAQGPEPEAADMLSVEEIAVRGEGLAWTNWNFLPG